MKRARSGDSLRMDIALSYLSPKVSVRNSPIHGRGLFAVADIPPGEIVCVKGGHIFTRATLDKQSFL